MGIINYTEEKSLINELTQGKELANQLRNHLNSSSNQSTRQFLVEKILSTYEKSLSLLNKTTSMATDNQDVPITKRRRIDSLNDNCSPTSDQDCNFNHKDLCKKRKTMPRWTEYVQICTAKGNEGSLDDGYSWRKYGQKDILGANFPRGYYRCTHRHTQNCLATKQVQRTDEDATILEVTYRGSHSCSSIDLKSSSMVQSPVPSVINSDSVNYNSQRQQQNQSQDPFVKFGTEKVVDTKDEIFPSFTFPCAAIESDNKTDKDNIFMGDLILDQSIFIMSPELDNCFLMSDFGIGNTTHISQRSESDYTTDTFSAPTSVSNSPIGGEDLDFSMVKVEFDPNFPFDNPDFFS
jgi:hypothetical protein